MPLPESLPARLYLLAYDTEKNRMTAHSRLGLDELAVYTGPITDALRKAWRARQAQQASG